MKKAVIILSGGMDSVTLLHYVKREILSKEDELYALSFDYGQKHCKELICAKKQCIDLKVFHKIIDMKWFGKDLASNSSLTEGEKVPEGYYNEENMKQTVVPFRNGVMLSLAIACAENINANIVYYGAHGGDHCLAKDTNVLTFEGLKNIENLTEKDKVFSFNIEENKWEEDEVVKVFKKNIVNEIVEITTLAGKIRLTDEHKVYVLRLGNFHPVCGYSKSVYKVEVKNLKEDDYLVQPTNIILSDKEIKIDLFTIAENILKKYNKPPKLVREDGKIGIGNYKNLFIDENINIKDFVSILAWYITEGWSSKVIRSGDSRFSAAFCQSIKQNLEKVEYIISKLKNSNIPVRYEFSKVLHNNIPKEITFYFSNIMSLFMKDCGLDSYNKQIPDWLFNILLSSLEIREEFIRSICLGDGSFYNEDVKGFCSTSSKLLQQYITLLQFSGYHFSVGKKQGNTNYILFSKRGTKQALISLGEAKFSKIRSIKKISYNDYVYDISVKKNNNFCAGEYGQLLVSNSIYPDCRPEFEKAVSLAGQLGTFNKVVIKAPFNEMEINKYGILKLGIRLGINYEDTWTCYVGEEKPCGKCGSCTERNESFLKLNIQDPLYTNKEWIEAINYLKGVRK